MMRSQKVLGGSDMLALDPKQYLWTHPQDKSLSQTNIQNYDLLLTTYNRTNFVSFTGAGVSKPLGVFDWDKLMGELERIAKAQGFDEELPNKERYPEFAETLYKYLESKSQQSRYYELIKTRMAPHINTTSLTLLYLILSVDTHLTTNFDRSIEYAYNFLQYFADFFASKNNYEMPTLNYLKQLDIASKRPAVYYLHGSINEEVYIFKKSDYEKFYPSLTISGSSYLNDIEDCLKYFYKNKNILFIGFSFQDPYVKKLFWKLAKDNERAQAEKGEFYYSQNHQKINTREVRHFVLIEESQLMKGFEFDKNSYTELEKHKIYPIIYQADEHIFLELLFKYFVEKNKGIME